MPVCGLPCAVEGALSNLLNAGQVTTWRIQGQGNTTTLTLKFRENEEGAMDDLPRNVHYRKKSKGQVTRDKRRTEDFHATREKNIEEKETVEDLAEKEKEVNLDRPITSETEMTVSRPTTETKREVEISSESVSPEIGSVTTQQPELASPMQISTEDALNTLVSQQLQQESQTQEKEKQQLHSVRSTFIPSKTRSEAEQRLEERNFEPDNIASQINKMSIRMKRLFKSTERNNKFDYVCTANFSDSSDDIVAETDDFVFCCQTAGENKKVFIVKNSDRYRSVEEELLLEVVRTRKRIDYDKFKTKLDDMQMDLLLINDFIKIHLSGYELEYY